MSLTAQIEETIKRLRVGRSFTYADINVPANKYSAAAKALERLQKKGEIKRISKGIFYKPEQTIFGELKPSDAEVINTYLFRNGQRIAYLTGTYLYNKMMLTTQVPNTWKIASFNNRIFVNRQKIKAKPVKAYAEVTDNNYKMLGFLDALKDWNTIPDLNISSGLQILLNSLKDFNSRDIENLKSIALKYPPRVRAFIGALLDTLKFNDLEELKQSLNPLSTYNIWLNSSDLPTAKNWNIQ